MGDHSALWAATDRLLRIRTDVGLEDWLTDRVTARQAAHPRGWADWRRLSADLADATGGIRVSHEALRRWWQRIDEDGAA